MKWSEFKNFDEYFTWFKKQPELSFKVGVFSPTERCTFTANGLFFKDFFPEPAAAGGVENCPVGKITDQRIILDRQMIYSGIHDEFIRQFDVFNHDEDFPDAAATPDRWLLLTHSCSLAKTGFANLVPAYFSENFKKNLQEIDPARVWKKPADEQKKNVFRTIEDNKSPRFVALPPDEELIKPDDRKDAQYLIVDLDQTLSMAQKVFLAKKPIRSFSFEGLSYLQARFTLRIARDLKMTCLADWDDHRTLGQSR